MDRRQFLTNSGALLTSGAVATAIPRRRPRRLPRAVPSSLCGLSRCTHRNSNIALDTPPIREAGGRETPSRV